LNSGFSIVISTKHRMLGNRFLPNSIPIKPSSINGHRTLCTNSNTTSNSSIHRSMSHHQQRSTIMSHRGNTCCHHSRTQLILRPSMDKNLRSTSSPQRGKHLRIGNLGHHRNRLTNTRSSTQHLSRLSISYNSKHFRHLQTPLNQVPSGKKVDKFNTSSLTRNLHTGFFRWTFSSRHHHIANISSIRTSRHTNLSQRQHRDRFLLRLTNRLEVRQLRFTSLLRQRHHRRRRSRKRQLLRLRMRNTRYRPLGHPNRISIRNISPPQTLCHHRRHHTPTTISGLSTRQNQISILGNLSQHTSRLDHIRPRQPIINHMHRTISSQRQHLTNRLIGTRRTHRHRNHLGSNPSLLQLSGHRTHTLINLINNTLRSPTS